VGSGCIDLVRAFREPPQITLGIPNERDTVEAIPTDPDDRKPEAGAALCLSGGGYRAMIFHVGVLWRLYEAGLLGGIKRIFGVSGGSITAGLLALKWRELSFKAANLANDFVPKVVRPLRAMASETIDADAVILGGLLPGRISDRVARAYDATLVNGGTLQDLPDEPRFVINGYRVPGSANRP
jgi:NTE family protein